MEITLAFVGYANAEMAGRATEFEDAVLQLLEEHGASLLFRGRRLDDQDPNLPLEVHVISFPGPAALESYLADDRRRKLLREFGDVFLRKESVIVEPITPMRSSH